MTIKVDRSCKDTSLLVIGVVSADLGSAGSGIQVDVVPRREYLQKAIYGFYVSFRLILQSLIGVSVKPRERLFVYSFIQIGQDALNVHTHHL